MVSIPIPISISIPILILEMIRKRLNLGPSQIGHFGFEGNPLGTRSMDQSHKKTRFGCRNGVYRMAG